MATNAWELKTFPLSLLIQFGNEDAFSKCLDNKCHKLCGDAPKLYLEGIHNFKCFYYFKNLTIAAYIPLLEGKKEYKKRIRIQKQR